MSAIDWDQPGVQKVDAVPTLAEVRERLCDDEFVRRLTAAMNELPPASRWLSFRLWLGEGVWRAREAAQRLRLYL